MDNPSNNNNIHQKHSQSLKTLLTVPIQQNTQQQHQQQQHSPTNSFCSVGNISINTIASSSTVFPTSTKEDVCKVTCFPVILPKHWMNNKHVLNKNTNSDFAHPSTSNLHQNIPEPQNNKSENCCCCQCCNNKLNVSEQEKQEKQTSEQLTQQKHQTKHKTSKPEETSKNNIIVIPPTEQQENSFVKQITSMPLPERQNEHVEDEDGTSHIKLLQQKLFEHYHTVAYTIVIFTCFLAFCEYLYLRLVSFIFPEPIIYRRKCEKHYNEVVLRNELHFASGLAVFLVMGIFQILCFFLLTISKKLLDVRRITFSQVISIEERLHMELVFAVKRTMFATLFPTFAIYLLCSSVIYCDIFYMVGIRDPIVHGGSLIIIYIFDACVILYFLAFPILCILFHPEINCCQTRMSKICCCFTCIWQNQRRRRDRANAQPLGNRHLELSKIQNYKIIKKF
uniref:Uncharacterized protein n=1 Tax=Meloidogyne enterolobii TaxID=390850 RepID=A0A6V7UXY2_MELEN|nr:unnamed protein product [Meloidogyne enterolobii]